MTADTKRVFWKCQRKGCRAVRVTDLPADNRGAYLAPPHRGVGVLHP